MTMCGSMSGRGHEQAAVSAILSLHIPYDKDFRIRNTEAVIVNPYFEERVSVAIHPELIESDFTFDVL